MKSVWVCGAAAAKGAVIAADGTSVAWCATCDGGKKIRAALGAELVDALSLANAVDRWPGRTGNQDTVPPAIEGIKLLRRIAASQPNGQDAFLLLIGISFWKSVLNLAAQNHRARFAFYNDPLAKRGFSLQGAFNAAAILCEDGHIAKFQIEFVPHTNFWCSPRANEARLAYVKRTATSLGQNEQLDLTKDDFESVIESTVHAAHGELEVDRENDHWDHDPTFSK